MSDLGTITADGATRTICFERVLEHPIEEVRAALTEAEQLGEWLAVAEVEPGPDGAITLDFGDGERQTGNITAWEPPQLLSYEWAFVGETLSHIRFELSIVGDGAATHLRLEHSLLEASAGPGYGAGWHAHLDQLEGHLERDAGPWQERFDALLPGYREAAAKP